MFRVSLTRNRATDTAHALLLALVGDDLHACPQGRERPRAKSDGHVVRAGRAQLGLPLGSRSPMPAHGRVETAGSRNYSPQTGRPGHRPERLHSGDEIGWWGDRIRPSPDFGDRQLESIQSSGLARIFREGRRPRS